MAATPGWRVEVTGTRRLFDALDEVDKKAANLIRKEITEAGKNVAAAASYYTPASNPVSNWGPWMQAGRGRDASYDGTRAASGFKVRRNNFRRRGVSAGLAFTVEQSNIGGSIYELMGSDRPTKVTTRAGRHLAEVMNERYPQRRPRSLFRAYYDVMTNDLRDRIRDRILDEARKAGLV